MGADIYFPGFDNAEKEVLRELGVKSSEANFFNLHDPEKEKRYWELMRSVEDKFYFRDSYNNSNTLWRYGLSWWKDVGALLNKRGNLSGKNLKKFHKMLTTATFSPLTRKETRSKDAHWGKMTDKEIAEWNEYWVKEHAKLVQMVKDAIEVRGAVRCSI